MRSTASNDGTVDNIMDDSDCFTVNLPVTIIANGITLTIESLDDLGLIEIIFEQNANDEDDIEFLFPITIILNDYTEVNIESLEELETFIENCVSNEEVIECVDFVYPITFSIYNTNFQVIDTVEINNDYELYIFLSDLENGNQGVLASLNFPVSLIYANGDTIEVTSNQELQDAIAAAESDCSVEECEANYTELIGWLVECDMDVYTFDENGDAIDENQVVFNLDGTVIVNGTPAVTETGNWSIDEFNENALTIEGLVTFDLLNGEWTLEGCNEDRIVFSQSTGSGSVSMELVMNCDTNDNPLGCLEASDITICDENNDGYEVFNIYSGLSPISGCTVNNPVSVSFHTSLMDAESNSNPIPSATAFTNTTSPQTVYVRIELISDTNVFEILEIGLYLENCTGGDCSENEVDANLVECIWNVIDFDGSDNLIVYDLDFNADGTLIITGNGLTIASMWSTSSSGSGTIVDFGSVAGPDIQAISGSWVVNECQTDRFVLTGVNNNSTMIMGQDCSNCDNPGALTDDLVIYMPFGGEVKDLISNEVVNGFTFLTEDRAGNSTCAVSFDGNTNFSIPVTSQNQLVQGDSFSISLWFKMQNTDAGDLEIFFRKPGNATVGFNLGVYDLNSPLFFDNLGTSLWDNDWNQEVDVDWQNTDWHHLVVTVDANNTVRLYRDGALRNTIENSDLSIGADAASQYIIGEGFQGNLDDLRIYKRALSDNDVGDLYSLEAECYTCL